MIGQPIEGPLPTDGSETHCLPQRERFDSGFDTQRKSLGQGALDHITGAVVDQLGYGPGPDRTHMDDLVANCVEHRLVALKDLRVTADPHRQLAAFGSSWSATDRRIEHVDPPLAKERVQASNQGWRIGAQGAVDLPRLQTLQQP